MIFENEHIYFGSNSDYQIFFHEEKLMSAKKEDKKKSQKAKEKDNDAKDAKKEEKDVSADQAEKVEDTAKPHAGNPPVHLTFYSYLIMLGALGWQFLGKIPNPQTGKIDKNLIQVKEIIDLLEILEIKTTGNLSKEEDNIMKSTLSNLRLNYVEEIKK